MKSGYWGFEDIDILGIGCVIKGEWEECLEKWDEK